MNCPTSLFISDWVVPLLLLFLPFRGIQGLRCHECTGVTDPHHCSMVVHCAADEKCHTEKVIGENSAVFYNLGCQKIQLCHLAANGKRSDVDVCQGCCGTDLCNAELWCPASNRSTTNSSCRDEPYMDCKLADDAHSICAERTLAAVKYCQKYCGYCSADGSTLPPPTGTTIDTCIDSGDIDCKQMNDSLHLCDKKDSPPALLYCPKFCGICIPSGGTTTPTPHATTTLTTTKAATTTTGSTKNSSCRDEPYMDCKLADDTHNICAERTLAAVRYCQKYCHYCSADGSTLPPPTGTTIDTCIDSGDIDCKQMNDSLHICAMKNSPPTTLYCPKFCGICTPSSGDKVTNPSSAQVTTVPATTQVKTKMTTQLPKTTQPTMKVTVPSTTLAASTSPPPKTLPPTTTTCALCACPKFLCEKLHAPTPCPPPNNYCINTITNHKNGTKSVDRACGSFDTCYREWFLGSSDNDKCRKLKDNDEQRLDFQCTFCCIKDSCNSPLHPADNTLYKPV